MMRRRVQALRTDRRLARRSDDTAAAVGLLWLLRAILLHEAKSCEDLAERLRDRAWCPECLAPWDWCAETFAHRSSWTAWPGAENGGHP